MRTKTLLIAAAALVATVISSEAQTVYSANVVGYAQIVIKGNGSYNLLANPFDDGNGNQLTNVISTTALALPKQSQCLTWNPAGGYITINATGTPATWASNIQLPPGIGFFIRNGKVGGGDPDVTNTFVGTVIVPSGGSVTNAIAAGYQMYGATIPYIGNIANNGLNGGDTNLDFGGPLTVKKSQILTFNPATGFATVNKTGTPPLWASTVTIGVGQGFFINNLATTTNMVQNASY
jgi:hypothetical protein